jgi:hypothetical protein
MYYASSGTPSKKHTVPVSSEYSAPTTSRRSRAINRSSTDDPCRRWSAEARMFGPHRLVHERVGVVPQLGGQQALHRGAHAVHDRAEVGRQRYRHIHVGNATQ